MSEFTIEGFDHVALAVRDLAASREWYERVLGLERRFEEEWGDVPSVMCAGMHALRCFRWKGKEIPLQGATVS